RRPGKSDFVRSVLRWRHAWGRRSANRRSGAGRTWRPSDERWRVAARPRSSVQRSVAA
ncbi:unnamed protein product, partial [Effrenium voratum]